jgi:osmoprotectant transport system ATP-binding protein
VGYPGRIEESEAEMIKLEEVAKIYPDGTEAVKGISFEIQNGEFCVLLGPSGCGKTTTMKMINRLIPITSGRILVDGADNTKLDVNDLRRGIGYAIQEIGLFPHMTVSENITTVPRLLRWAKGKCRQRAIELLELVGLVPVDNFLDKYPAELSGGQCQRVGVARSLGADPPVLLMDEPFGAIDPITRERLQDEFLRIQGEIKKTIAFVTHDINEAIKMGDRIALIQAGKLVQYDTPAELLSRPKDDFVRSFVGADRALKSLRLMRVKEVMRASPPTVSLEEGLSSVRKQMESVGLKWLMAVDDERFMGWVSWEDLGKGEKVRDIIIPPATTATPNTPLNQALSLMLNSAIGNLGVVDDEERLLGVLTFDCIRNVIVEFQSEGEER